MWNTKEYILKNVEWANSFAIHLKKKKKNWDISQNMFFHVPQKTGLEWHEVE